MGGQGSHVISSEGAHRKTLQPARPHRESPRSNGVAECGVLVPMSLYSLTTESADGCLSKARELRTPGTAGQRHPTRRWRIPNCSPPDHQAAAPTVFQAYVNPVSGRWEPGSHPASLGGSSFDVERCSWVAKQYFFSSRSVRAGQELRSGGMTWVPISRSLDAFATASRRRPAQLRSRSTDKLSLRKTSLLAFMSSVASIFQKELIETSAGQGASPAREPNHPA